MRHSIKKKDSFLKETFAEIDLINCDFKAGYCGWENNGFDLAKNQNGKIGNH